MMRPSWWLLFVVIMAGCVGTDAEGPGEDVQTGSQGQAGTSAPGSTEVGPPVWAIGDHWSYDLGGQTATWIVTEDTGEGWVVDTDDEDLAFQHAAFEEISTLGNISKELDGSQGEDSVRFFDWPLVDGKQWDLRWDGQDFQATLEEQGNGVWSVQAVRDGTVQREYTYDEGVGWFRSLRAMDENGTLLWEAALSASGHGYTGSYVRWQVYDAVAFDLVGTTTVPVFLEVPEAATEVWYSLRITCDPGGLEGDQGVYGITIGPGGDASQGYMDQGICPLDLSPEGTLEPVPGRWDGVIHITGVSIQGAFASRTLETFSL